MEKINQLRRQLMAYGMTGMIWMMTGCTSKTAVIDGAPPHYTADGFRNYPPAPRPEMPGISFLFRRMKDLYEKPVLPKGHVIEESTAVSQFTQLYGHTTITWIGHTTYLIRIENTHLLLDPFFSDIASPLPFGPERYVAPGISLQNLPRIDGVVISHNHYDHLDAKAIEALKGKENIQVFVPLGLRSFFVKRGYSNVQELDWHQSFKMGKLKLTALPAVHFSGRGLGDRNNTLWCSWAIESGAKKCFFAGDTAYSPTIFKEIGKKFKSFDGAIVPIGAYEPVNVMKPVHTNPEEAILVANDVKADIIIPSHWGTITLSDEPPWEPLERYKACAAKLGISDRRACTMKIGETKII